MSFKTMYEWIAKVQDEIKLDIIIKYFKKHNIYNNSDGSEDDSVYNDERNTKFEEN